MTDYRDQQDQTAASPSPDDNLKALVIRAREGDRRAFKQLVEQFHEAVFRMVYYRIGLRLDAEDITQDVFIKALEGLTRLRDAELFKAWLFRIAVNRVKDFKRKKHLLVLFRFNKYEKDEHRELEIEDLEAKGPLDHLVRDEFWNKVRLFARCLSKWEREVFFLRFLDQLTVKEIACALNRSESTIKTYLYRGLKKFKNNSILLDVLEE